MAAPNSEADVHNSPVADDRNKSTKGENKQIKNWRSVTAAGRDFKIRISPGLKQTTKSKQKRQKKKKKKKKVE